MVRASIKKTTIQSSARNGIKATDPLLLVVDEVRVLLNFQVGITATFTNSNMLRMTASLVANNVLGGVSSVGGKFDITNNIIHHNNGDEQGIFGGLRADSPVGGNRLEHNTIVHNTAQLTTSYAGGVYCRGVTSANNNIVANNFAGNATQPNANTAGTCPFGSSLIATSSAAFNFVSISDFHLSNSSSIAANAGTVSIGAVTTDFDGEARSDGQPDVGADEL